MPLKIELPLGELTFLTFIADVNYFGWLNVFYLFNFLFGISLLFDTHNLNEILMIIYMVYLKFIHFWANQFCLAAYNCSAVHFAWTFVWKFLCNFSFRVFFLSFRHLTTKMLPFVVVVWQHTTKFGNRFRL